MGREIRRVPVDWKHPKGDSGYQPMYDEDYETAMEEWLKKLEEWKRSEFEKILKGDNEYEYRKEEPYRAFADYHGTVPDPLYYRPKWHENAVFGYAVYETVSEGTPVTPTFSTKKELVDHLVTKGTLWDEGRPWDRMAAERFVKCEYAPSAVAIVDKDGKAQFFTPKDAGMYSMVKNEEKK